MKLSFLKKLLPKKYGTILLLVFVVSAFFPVFQAHAADSIPTAIANWAADNLINPILNFFLLVSIRLLVNLQLLLNTSIHYTVLDSQNQPFAIVTTSWGIIRNFANMFFIIGLIIMAFATIFNVSRYNFRTLIARFLIAALLINFSLVIGTTIIGWSQDLSGVFLNSIGDIGNRLGQELCVTKFLGGQSCELLANSNTASSTSFLSLSTAGSILEMSMSPYGAATGLAYGVGAQAWKALDADPQALQVSLVTFFNIIMIWIIVIALTVGLVMSVARIPILMILLIVSPIAWISSIMPQTNNINRRWWNYFLGWNLFLPIYLFFIYFGMYFLHNLNIGALTPTNSANAMASIGGFGWTVQAIFGYLLTAAFLIGGAKYSMNSSLFAGAGGVAAGVWARGQAAARFTAGGLASPLTSRLGYVGRAAGERVKEVQQKGLPGKFGIIYGGEEGRQRAGSVIAGGFGAQETADKAMAQAVTSAKQRLQKISDVKQLEALAKTGKRNEQIAALELIEERFGGLTKADDVMSLYNLYGGASSQNARKALDKIDVKRFSKEDRDKLYSFGDLRLKQKIADARAERGDFADIKDASGNITKSAEDVFVEQSTIFTSEADRADFIKKAKDFVERLKPEQRRSIFDNSQTSAEMKRELAITMAEKGDFTDIKDKTTGAVIKSAEEQLKEVAGLYEAANQRDNFLSKAQKKNTVAAIRAKRDLNLLGTDTYEEALSKAARKMTTEDIFELSKEALADDDLQKALAPTITPKRIESLSTSPKATAEKLQALNSLFFSIKNNAFIDAKIKPLSEYLDKIKQNINDIKAAKATNDTQKQKSLLEDTRKISLRASSLVDQIDRSPDADQFQKDAAKREYEDIVSLIKKNT